MQWLMLFYLSFKRSNISSHVSLSKAVDIAVAHLEYMVEVLASVDHSVIS